MAVVSAAMLFLHQSPALKLMDLLEERGCQVEFHDPHLDEIPPPRAHPCFAGRRSVMLEPAALARFDAVCVVTDHDYIDYALISRHARIIVDTGNAMRRRGLPPDNVVLS